MTLDECYLKHRGTSVPSFDGNPADNGQCVAWALTVRTEVYELPVRYGNAINWWTTRGTDIDYFDYVPYTVGNYPKKGDFVVWGTEVGSQFGHIDSCAEDGNGSGFLGYDSNWSDVPVLKTIHHDYSLGVLGYIRLKEKRMNPNDGDVINLYQYANGRPATPEEIAVYTNKTWNAPDGLLYGKFVVDFLNMKKQLETANAQLVTAGNAPQKLAQIKEIVS
jgi:hypothetical protein